MRDLIEFIPSVLIDLGVPVKFQGYPPGHQIPEQYITFLEYHSNPDLEAADQEWTTDRLIQINVWSKTNYTTLVNKVRTILEMYDFERIAEFDVPYTDGDSHLNKVMRFRLNDEYKE